MTPEYAHAIGGVRIPLTEQVTLQLGCVGSRSKISFGTRVPVEFGGVRGHVYFDQVNLDRYDVVIGTPFMNKHGLILDFGTREIQFPRGQSIKALSSLEEASLVDTRNNREHCPSPSVVEILDVGEGNPLPTLPYDYRYILITEEEYNGYPTTQSAPKLWRATVLEVEDDQEELLPSLPWSSPIIMAPEAEWGVHCKSDALPPNLVNADGAESATCHDTEEERRREELPQTDQVTADEWKYTVSFGLLCAPRDRFVEDLGHPLAPILPGLIPWDYVSSHSSIEQVSDMGDNDPHGLCAEAIEEAVRCIALRSAHIVGPEVMDGETVTPR
ncbi:hypothetical protein K438DRAFT_1998233 [Mycena galopus ATCC 62051]|nr:hypothetical protein K438DRAFT_1998233 [Mycena galopus ATCC 62051]